MQQKPTEIVDDLPIICQKLNTFVSGICKYLSYLNLVLIATIFIQVVLRYVFNTTWSF